jgi:hypothetical protein
MRTWPMGDSEGLWVVRIPSHITVCLTDSPLEQGCSIIFWIGNKNTWARVRLFCLFIINNRYCSPWTFHKVSTETSSSSIFRSVSLTTPTPFQVLHIPPSSRLRYNKPCHLLSPLSGLHFLHYNKPSLPCCPLGKGIFKENTWHVHTTLIRSGISRRGKLVHCFHLLCLLSRSVLLRDSTRISTFVMNHRTHTKDRVCKNPVIINHPSRSDKTKVITVPGSGESFSGNMQKVRWWLKTVSPFLFIITLPTHGTRFVTTLPPL